MGCKVPKDCKIEHYSCGVLEKTCKGVRQCWASKLCEEASSGAFHEMQQAIGSQTSSAFVHGLNIYV